MNCATRIHSTAAAAQANDGYSLFKTENNIFIFNDHHTMASVNSKIFYCVTRRRTVASFCTHRIDGNELIRKNVKKKKTFFFNIFKFFSYFFSSSEKFLFIFGVYLLQILCHSFAFAIQLIVLCERIIGEFSNVIHQKDYFIDRKWSTNSNDCDRSKGTQAISRSGNWLFCCKIPIFIINLLIDSVNVTHICM